MFYSICKLSEIFCGLVLSFLSTFAIILLRKRADCFSEVVPLLSWGVDILSLFLAMSWIGLWSIIVTFPAHCHLFYAPNFGQVEGAYCFWFVRPSIPSSVHPSAQTHFKIRFLDFIDEFLIKKITHLYFFHSGLSPFVE